MGPYKVYKYYLYIEILFDRNFYPFRDDRHARHFCHLRRWCYRIISLQIYVQICKFFQYCSMYIQMQDPYFVKHTIVRSWEELWQAHAPIRRGQWCYFKSHQQRPNTHVRIFYVQAKLQFAI